MRWGQTFVFLASPAKKGRSDSIPHGRDVSEAVYLADTIYVMAPRPTHILHRIDVPFFANRDIALKSSTEFRNVEKKLLDLHYAPAG
jgi:ABC-type nitrate/sulfonate/bicarbonate transport system ATPase subunit